MADLVANTTIALEVQSAPGAYETLDSSDRMLCANLSYNPQPITAENPEYTGSIHRPGPIRLGANHQVSFDILIRGYSGTTVPSSGAFHLGRILRALGFTEQVISAAIPASPQAVAAGSTTTATLGAGATGTTDLYKALAIQIEDYGIGDDSLVMISAYTSGKVATLAQTAGGTIAGNYQIPKQLAYTLASTGTPPLLSIDIWQGARKYEFGDMAPTSARLAFNTAGRDGGNNFCVLSVTFTGDLLDYSDEAAPVVTPTHAVPPFKGGKQHIANVVMGGSGITLDLGVRAGFPPNPNNASGSDAAQLVSTQRSLQLNLNQVAKSVQDFIAKAEAQTEFAIQALYGLAPGNHVGFIATAARFMDPVPQAGGEFYTSQGDAFVDGANKTIGLTFIAYDPADIG